MENDNNSQPPQNEIPEVSKPVKKRGVSKKVEKEEVKKKVEKVEDKFEDKSDDEALEEELIRRRANRKKKGETSDRILAPKVSKKKNMTDEDELELYRRQVLEKEDDKKQDNTKMFIMAGIGFGIVYYLTQIRPNLVPNA